MTMQSPGQIAPVNRRVLAYIIDAAIASGLGIVLSVIVTLIAAATGFDGMFLVFTIGMPIVSLLMLAWFIVYTVMQGGAGSIGMRAQGIRLVRADDGEALGFGRALLRNVVFGVTAAIVVGYFSPLFDGTGRFQGWHDKAGGALMLEASAKPAASSDGAAQNSAAPAAAMSPTPTAETTMPGFATGAKAHASAPEQAPAAQTAMPGFGQRLSGPVPPVPPLPSSVPPVPPLPEVATPAPAGNVPTTDEDEAIEHTVISPRISRDLPDDPLISFVPGVTQEPVRPAASQTPVVPVAPVAPEPSAAAPVEPEPVTPLTPPVTAPADDPDDEDIESTRISVPGHRLVFTWDDGQRATVSGRTVFGRNPEDEGATNVAVRDETRSLSKTHFEAGADTRGGWVMDRQSTNGTTLVRDGVRMACPPGQKVPVHLGDALEIGDRIVTIGGYV